MTGGMKPGKRFEQKFREAMEGNAYILRIPDNVFVSNGHLASTETDADFMVVTASDSYLVECKATNRPSLEYYNVKEHQEQALEQFDALGESCHGFLAVEFYDRRGYRFPHRAFLLPISEWLGFRQESERSSMPLREFERRAVELPYEQGGYAFDGQWFFKEERIDASNDM